MRIRIDRGVCKRSSFAERLRRAAALDHDIDVLALATGTRIDCGTCRPWLERPWAAGQTRFALAAADTPDGPCLLARFGSGRCARASG